ncbi:MAG TPA: UvrB/UvrC motif-containing protein, partial [Candidatus Dojkabacteria bacterium]|nr:UvrB/UvrC motif-containing protein [Candidatus Dojkabacteria bacterium]
MLPLISDIEVVETNNEIEALVLESALVRKFKPKFNSNLKDDKSYAWIYINTQDRFPTVKIVRTIRKGEYKKGRLFGPYPSGYTIKRVYSYLRKLYPFCTCKNHDCASSLYYHIGLCPGPYIGAISEEDYRKNINNIIKFLSGKQQDHIKRLEKEMKEYSKRQQYEKASQLRDRIKDLKYISQDIDFTYYDDALSYESRRDKARKISFNYLGMELHIPNLHRIECFDISNIQGKNAYGSMVVAEDGKLNRSEYRIFKIKGEDKPNDYKMLREVLERRFKDKDKKVDLVLIDGGKGQLNVVKDVIHRKVSLMGISKGRYLKRKGKNSVDEFWILKDGNVYRIDIASPEILIDLRNEAHRFAISY